MQPELIENALKSGKNLLILHDPGTGLYANISSIMKKTSKYFVSPVNNINSLLHVLNEQEQETPTLIIDIEECDFIMTSILKSIFRDGEFHYITPTKDLKYTVKNRIILTTHKQDIFNLLKVGAEESGGLTVNWICTPEEKIQKLREIFLASLVSDVEPTKAEEIFIFCYSKVGYKLNLRHLISVISHYKSSGFYKTFGSKYLKK
jgi:hypothetical protein